ncbi:hypothetical protein K3495_g12700 [Podosphaera aphanis]|nr:hypothetical protein K3495_g12700 [Podosphaera aphanis]
MSNYELQKWVKSEVDFYDFLGISEEACSEAELRRAYRKTALKYHPDKAGANFDAAKYELFQAAVGVLSHPILRAAYDRNRRALLEYRRREKELIEIRWRQIKEKEAKEKEAREMKEKVREAQEKASLRSGGMGINRSQEFFRENQRMAVWSMLKTINTLSSSQYHI